MFYVGMNLRVGLILLSHSNSLHLAENDGLPYDYFFSMVIHMKFGP